jgi:hypothetical protein
MESERALMEEELKHLQRRLKILERAMSTDASSESKSKPLDERKSCTTNYTEYARRAL